jgi:hypothetical protein
MLSDIGMATTVDGFQFIERVHRLCAASTVRAAAFMFYGGPKIARGCYAPGSRCIWPNLLTRAS